VRIRTGHGPNDWTENEPSVAVSRIPSGFMARPAANVGAMVPVLSTRLISDEQREKERVASQRYRDRHAH
jgi:hypothetical protein